VAQKKAQSSTAQIADLEAYQQSNEIEEAPLKRSRLPRPTKECHAERKRRCRQEREHGETRAEQAAN
jgi:hypothetical protein